MAKYRRGEIRQTQPYCVASGISISSERVPSAFLQMPGGTGQPVAYLATHKARTPPRGCCSRRLELGNSPRRHRVEIWPRWPRWFRSLWLHVRHVDLRPPRRARIPGVASVSCTASGDLVRLIPFLNILKTIPGPREVRSRGSAWGEHHRSCKQIKNSLSSTIRNWRSHAFAHGMVCQLGSFPCLRVVAAARGSRSATTGS